jgi:hypothetical protein
MMTFELGQRKKTTKNESDRRQTRIRMKGYNEEWPKVRYSKAKLVQPGPRSTGNSLKKSITSEAGR